MKNTRPRRRAAIYLALWSLLVLATGPGRTPSLMAQNAATDTLAVELEVSNLAAEDPTLSRLDLYIKILYDDLQFVKTATDSFSAQYVANLEVFDDLGLDVGSKQFKDRVQVKTMDEVNSRSDFVLKRVSFELPPAEYEVVFKMQDLETLRVSERKTTLKLRDFSGQDLLASDILFLDDVEKRDDGKFVFQPRVSEWQNKDRRILIYFEVYNVPERDSIKVKYAVLDAGGNTKLSYAYTTNSTGRITQNFIDIEGESLPHGAYLAKVDVESLGKKLELEKDFSWYLEGMPRYLTDIDDAIRPLRYLASDKEYEYLLNLDEKEKYTEFVRFWKSRDPTPMTAENELRDSYYDRVAYANSKYHSLQKEGWRTDRGWVYIMLGPPDNIEREPYNASFSTRRLGKTVKAIQVWVYHKYNRQFLFYDSNGFGDYDLDNPETLYEIIE